MKKLLATLLAACCLTGATMLPANALEYSFDAPDNPLFGRPTSDDTIYVTTGAPVNTDRSKNAALIPPAFGSPTSYVLGSGELLTPNLIRDGQIYTGPGNSTSTNTGTTTIPNTSTVPTLPSVDTSGSVTAYTPVTDALYYSGGYIATLSIPAIGLTVKVNEGTSAAALATGAGHFENTSIWNGNVAIAGHNRGVNNHFGKIHTLSGGDTITLTTKLGTRTYEVYSVQKIRYRYWTPPTTTSSPLSPASWISRLIAGVCRRLKFKRRELYETTAFFAPGSGAHPGHAAHRHPGRFQ